jgi:3-methyladenine DNA glycosylase/8-oxoguanine DNA glycosylase
MERYAHWLPPPMPLFHAAVSCVIAQRIAFRTSRAMRMRLIEALNRADNDSAFLFTREALRQLTDEQWRATKLDARRRALIERLIAMDPLVIDESIDGIGPWTAKAVRVMAHTDNTVALFEDGYIQRRVGELLSLRSADAHLGDAKRATRDFLLQWPERERSAASRFLWRITGSGVLKILDQAPLTRDDFL